MITWFWRHPRSAGHLGPSEIRQFPATKSLVWCGLSNEWFSNYVSHGTLEKKKKTAWSSIRNSEQSGSVLVKPKLRCEGEQGWVHLTLLLMVGRLFWKSQCPHPPSRGKHSMTLADVKFLQYTFQVLVPNFISFILFLSFCHFDNKGPPKIHFM